MLSTAFSRLQKNQGGLLSFNNFLSTSTSKEISLKFAEKALAKPDKVAILFEMTIDPSISSVPFACLDQLSYFKAAEKEVLFSMHTIFRIGEITSVDNGTSPRFWHVRLTSTNADDQQLRQLTEYMRIELTSTLSSGLHTTMDPTWRLGKLLINMGEYERALVIWELILNKAIHDNDLELIQSTHYEMAEFFMIYRDDWNRAKSHLREMFSLQSFDDRAVAEPAKEAMTDVFSTIRGIFMREDLDEDEFHSIMAETLSQLISLYLDHPANPLGPLDFQIIADQYNYVGWIHRRQGNLSEAWTNLERALQLLREHLPSTHPRLALTYHHMGLIHSDRKNYFRALECLQKAQKIQEKALQPHHPHLAESHFQLSITFEHLKQIDDAFHHAKKTVEIGRHACLPMKEPPMKQYREHLHRIRSVIQSSNELVL